MSFFIIQRLLNNYMSFFANVTGLSATGIMIFYGSHSAETVGFGIMFLMNFGAFLSYVIRQVMAISLQMTSVERLLKYTDLKSEAALHTPYDKEVEDHQSGDWPSKGEIVFQKVRFRYRQELEDTLRGINLQINGGEKVGCVGRTGAGKSSMIQRYCRGVFTKGYKKTIGVDFIEKRMR